MPEQISKYPEVTLEVLEGAGARCGAGVEQKILKQCPPERFCSTPTGEICVYGLADVPTMTQITPAELRQAAGAPQRTAGATEVAALVGALIIGLVVGRIWGRAGA